MTRLAAVLSALALCASCARAQGVEVRAVELELGVGRARVAGGGAESGAPTPSHPDLDTERLPEGALWYEVTAAPVDGEPVPVARGLLPEPGVALSETVRRFDDPLVVRLPRDATRVRIAVPAALAPERVGVYRRIAAGRETMLAEALPAGAVAAGPSGTRTLVRGATSPENRLGVLLLPDGFRADELRDGEPFETTTGGMVTELLKLRPFTHYGHLLRFSRLEVASEDGALAIEGDDPLPDTAFRTQLAHWRDETGAVVVDDQERELHPATMLLVPDDGVERALRAGGGERRDITVVVCVEATPGVFSEGGGGPSPLAAIGMRDPAVRLAHALGHSFGLGDEVAAVPPLCAPPLAARPNAMPAERAAEAWADWRAAGLFSAPAAGGLLCDAGAVHALDRCVMRRTPDAPFCEICSEAIVHALWERVRLIDTTSPAAAAQVEEGASPRFEAQCAVTDKMTVVAAWTLDGAPVAAGDARLAEERRSGGATYAFSPGALAPGRHVVHFLLEDRTPVPAERIALTLRSPAFPHEARWDVVVTPRAGVGGLAVVGEPFAAGMKP